jgi:hypothetical protein
MIATARRGKKLSTNADTIQASMRHCQRMMKLSPSLANEFRQKERKSSYERNTGETGAGGAAD